MGNQRDQTIRLWIAQMLQDLRQYWPHVQKFLINYLDKNPFESEPNSA